MPAWALLALKILLPLLLQDAVKSGAFTQAQADGIKDIKDLWNFIKNLQTFPAEGYPTGTNGRRDAQPSTPNNLFAKNQ